METRKTDAEKLKDLQARIQQLMKREKTIQAYASKAKRAARTRRLIQNGAMAEKYPDCENIGPAVFEMLLKEMAGIEAVKEFLKKRK